MIEKLQNIIFKEAMDKYVECHNAIRQIIEDSIGTVDSDVVDKIMCVIIENYKV
jgi:hypothetical protein